MKLANILKKIIKEENPIDGARPSKKIQQPVKQDKPQTEEDPLRSNIDQFWMNPDDLKNDLFKFLERVNKKDPKLCRFLINNIRNTIAKFRYAPDDSQQ